MLQFTLTALLLLESGVSAHYNFGILRVNGTRSSEFQYIRDVSPNATYSPNQEEWGKVYPLFEAIDSTNFTCGRNAIKFAPQTETATVIAGSEVAFKRNPYHEINVGPGYNNSLFHAGPGYVYMAKAPGDDLETFSGSEGKWFKVAEYLAENATDWKIRAGVSEINFTIPESTPPGKYLARVDQFTFTPYLQFYINCAQLNVIGSGGGNPGPFAKFPGEYNYTQMRQDATKGGYVYTNAGRFQGVGPTIWRG